MTMLRCTLITAFLGMWATTVAHAQLTKPITSEKQFGHYSVDFLEDPLGKNAKNYARAIMKFAIQTPKAAIVFGEEEMKWIGKDKKYSFLLFPAYIAGNTQSQLNSGVKRNDRYSGLLSLFRVYRTLKKHNKEFKTEAVEKLLKLHKEGKLVQYLLELEKKKPTTLTPKNRKSLQQIRIKRT